MSNEHESNDSKDGHEAKDRLRVTVVYPPAAKPFEDPRASRDETVGALKKRVLTAFGLGEGPQPDGSSLVCMLFHGKEELVDMARTLGAVAGRAEALALKLAQQITQGDGATSLSAMNLADDLAEVRSTADAARWEISLEGPTEVHVTLASVAAPGERFRARLAWASYPDEPPSLKFVDPATGALNRSQAWPQVRGFRPSVPDACVNYSAEGMALHPEWRTDPRTRWDARGNVLLKVLRILQDEMDHHFAGRSP